jgi:uncharacterized protein DUF6283
MKHGSSPTSCAGSLSECAQPAWTSGYGIWPPPLPVSEGAAQALAKLAEVKRKADALDAIDAEVAGKVAAGVRADLAAEDDGHEIPHFNADGMCECGCKACHGHVPAWVDYDCMCEDCACQMPYEPEDEQPAAQAHRHDPCPVCLVCRGCHPHHYPARDPRRLPGAPALPDWAADHHDQWQAAPEGHVMTNAIEENLPAPRSRPCVTCPYRRDCPSGIWHEEEYAKLPGYDGDVPDQVEAGAFQLFFCHTHPDKLCAGWVGTHDMYNNLAVRMHGADPSVYDYVSPYPLFGSGAEAAEHGLREIEWPDPDAIDMLERMKARQAGNVMLNKTERPEGEY